MAASLASLFQLLPLPRQLVAILSPERFDIAVANASALAESAPSFICLTYDRALTLHVGFNYACLALLAYCVLRVSYHNRGGRTRVLQYVAISASLICCVAVLHTFLGIEKVFGVYQPSSTVQAIKGPIVNANHLATVAILGCFLSIGFVRSTIASGPKVAWGSAALVCGSVLIWTGSRGAAVSVAVVGVLAGAWFAAKSPRKVGEKAVLSLLMMIAAVALVFAASQAKSGETTDFGKVAVWKMSLTIAKEHPFVGSGAGAFEPATTPLLSSHVLSYSHAESQLMQWGATFGTPLLLIFMVLLWRAGRDIWRRPSGKDQFAKIAIAAAMLHCMVEFSFSLLGIAILLIATAAALTTPRFERTTDKRQWMVSLGIVLVAILSTVLFTDNALSPREDESRTFEEPIEVWRRHPADYVIAGYTAESLIRSRHPAALKVAVRAMDFHPTNPYLKMTLGRLFVESGRVAQGVLWYRQAIELLPRLANEACVKITDDQRLANAMPPQSPEIFVDRLHRCKRVAAAAIYARQVHDDLPNSETAYWAAFAENRAGNYQAALSFLKKTTQSGKRLQKALAHQGLNTWSGVKMVAEDALANLPAHNEERIEILRVVTAEAVKNRNMSMARKYGRILLKEAAASKEIVSEVETQLKRLELSITAPPRTAP